MTPLDLTPAPARQSRRPPEPPAFDRHAVRVHVRMLHELAEATNLDGVLVLFSTGENPATGRAEPPRAQHFRIGDVEGMTNAVMALQHILHRNIYAPWAIFRRDLERGSKGGESQVVAVLALVADQDSDTGKRGALPLPAPYIIESSPGNFQAVYPLARALPVSEAKPLAEALADAAGCDHRTKDVSGVWRIPGTLNWPTKRKVARGRPAEPLPVRVAEDWTCELVEPEELRAAVAGSVKPKPNGSGKPNGADSGTSIAELLQRCGPAYRKAIRAPAEPEEDRSATAFSVISALIRKGLSDAEIARLIEAHPRGVGELYADGKDLAGDIRRARRKVEPPPGSLQGAAPDDRAPAQDAPSGDTRPTIRVRAGDLHNLASEAERALINGKAPLYVRGGEIVRPVVEDVEAARGRHTKVARLATVMADGLVDWLSRTASWEKYNERSKSWVAVDPPRSIATTILAREGEWRLPQVAGVITTPTLRPDGSVLSAPGYDPATRLLLVEPPAMPAIPEKPTRHQALDALAVLADLLTEFPFVDSASRAVALSALLTSVARGALTVAPLHAMRAPTPGSGKSYLVDIVAAVATGQRCPVIAAHKEEEENEKRLGSALLSGQPIISIDNLNGELRGDALCQMVERPVVMIRPLGRSELVRVESRATLFATGNNIVLVGDMVRRVVLCSLDPNIERPELRQFGRDPFGGVIADRGRYVAAALTVVRAYIAAGYPDELPALASFEDWSRLIRSGLVWLGQADPVATMEMARAEDPETTALREVVAAWRDAISVGTPMTASEIVQKAEERPYAGSSWSEGSSEYSHPILRDALMAIARDGKGHGISSLRLGKWLGSKRNRVIEGVKITGVEDTHSKTMRWELAQA